MLHKYIKVCGLVFPLLLIVGVWAGPTYQHWQVPSYERPSALASSGNLLLTSHYHFFYLGVQRLLSLYDVTTVGEEVLYDVLQASVHLSDMEFANEQLYGIGFDRTILYNYNFYTGEWQTIPVNGRPFESDHRKVLFYDPKSGLLYVLHQEARQVDVVDTVEQSVIHNFSLSGTSVVATREGDYLVTLSRGLQQPVCTSPGPVLALHRLPFGEQIYQVAVAGDCPQTVVVAKDTIYLIYSEEIRAYALHTAELLNRWQAPERLGSHALWLDGKLVVQSWNVVQGGRLLVIDAALTGVITDIPLLQQPQRLWPALKQMHFDTESNRLFIANSNDNALSIVRLGF